MAVFWKFVCIPLLAVILQLILSVKGLSDLYCPYSGYHHCSGTIWCCPDGYVCTGTSTCLSIGAIVGIVIGCLAGLSVLITLIVCCCRRARTPPPPTFVQQPGVSTVPQTQYGQPMTGYQPQNYGQPNTAATGYPAPNYGQPNPSYPTK